MTRCNLFDISISLGTSIGGPIKYGDKIQLINQYGTKSYLDTCDHSSCSGKYAIETDKKASCDSLWGIRSANEPNVGGPIKYGDKIQLMVKCGTKSYLDTCGGSNGNYGVQTSTSPHRDGESGTWVIKAVGDILGMDFLIDGQISLFCPDQHEGELLTLIMLHRLTQSL